MKKLFQQDFDRKYSPLALLAFYQFASNVINRDSLNTGLNTVLTNIYNRVKSDSLRPFVVRLLARKNALSKNFDKILFYNTEIIENYPSSVNELTALYDLITYYADIENDLTKAQPLFTRMLNTYPEEDLTKFAAINLGYNFENLKKITSSEQIPEEYYLSNAFPNPFNPVTQIKFSIPKDGFVTLKVFDILGREVATLINEDKSAGAYTANFDASGFASGIYFYSISSGSFHQTKKMILAK